MEHKVLEVETRTEKKKSAAVRLRKNGKIPAIVYGSHEPLMVQVDARIFKNNFFPISENTIIDLKNGGKSSEVIVKDVQYAAMTGEIFHIDFFELTKGRVLRTHIPVHLVGTAVGVREGGLLEHNLHEVEVECLPKDMPDDIKVDVSDLKIGASLHLSEIKLAPGLKLLGSLDTVVAHVVNTKTLNTADEPEATVASEAE